MTQTMPPAHRAFCQALAPLMPATRVYTDALSTLAFGTDASVYRLVPQVVVKVDNETEVGHVLRLARQHRVAVTFRAAGTSLSGQALSDSVLVLLGDGFNQAQVIDAGQRIRLAPGIIGSHANALLTPFGRKIGPDPASINSAKIGGIAANNSSGMCCGTHDNSYHTLAALRVLLLDGTLLDSADPVSVANFRVSHADLLAGLSALAAEIKADPAFEQRVRRKYRIKNTTGYGINALLDFSDPLEMLTHLMIGSEGTLGFIGEITLNTVLDHQHKASALVLFDALAPCCRAVTALSQGAPVDAVELIDSRSIRAVQHQPGLPDFLYQPVTPGSTCLLIETRAASAAELTRQCQEIELLLAGFAPQISSGFSSDSAQCASYWALRKGLFPAVGAVRPQGTSVVIEDVAFPIEHLADGVRGLTRLFDLHGYHQAVLFGHALDGNLHFVFTPSFDSATEVARYQAFMQDVSTLVAGDFDGSLKAEHGTGRNVAPFVRQEWGDQAWGIMCRIKALFDPESLLNPEVIITHNPRLHLENLKQMPPADPLVDACIECGFCEPACPAHGLTLSPRQRIVAWRRIQQLSASGADAEQLAALQRDFRYRAIDSCAATGMCATRCPVNINTGSLMLALKGATPHPKRARFAARHLGPITAGARVALRIATRLGPQRIASISTGLHRQFKIVPQLPAKLPRAAAALPEPTGSGTPLVLFISCVNRTLAADSQSQHSIAEHTVRLVERAGFLPIYPERHSSLCCGQPFASANAEQAANEALDALNLALMNASQQGRYPVYLDNSPCAMRIKQAQQSGRIAPALRLYDAASFLAQHVAPRLTISRRLPQLALHIPCSATRMGADGALRQLATLCAEQLTIPEIACCGFAGDKGFILPELNAHSLRRLAPALPHSCQRGVSMSRTCQIGLTQHAGFEYQSIEALLDDCSTPNIDPL